MEIVLAGKVAGDNGAPMAASWVAKFMMPPMRPTLSRGAMSEGMDQPTGAMAPSPPSERLIHNSARPGVWAPPAP